MICHLGWFRETGFRGKVQDIEVYWFPTLLAFVPVFITGTIEIPAGSIVFYFIALIFTAIGEEGLARGILLKALLPKGKWIALLFMALLFAASHFSNLGFEDFSPLHMTEKLTSTFSFGFLYGAVFLRTRNIWPLILLHAVHDFSFLISGTAGPYTVAPVPLEISFLLSVVSTSYGVFIVRNLESQKGE